MTKRICYIFAILSIVLLSLSLQSITPVLGLNATITDPENDVYRVKYVIVTPFGYGTSPNPAQQGDYHDEIDIVKFEINGQNMNLTFAGNIADWQSTGVYDTIAMMLLYPNFDMDLFPEEPQYPYYVAYYQNHSIYGPDYKLVFVHNIDNETSLYWEGVGWTDDQGSSANIGSASGKSIIANVPPGAYTIPDNVTYIVASEHDEYLGGSEGIAYLDVAPNEYEPWPDAAEDEIPSYNLIIMVGVLVGICLIIIKKKIK
jgi:hypothetical protein